MINIYILERNGIPFYVGKANDVVRRKHKHHQTYGNDITLTIIDKVEDWKYWEEYWIEQFKTWGFTLLNQNKGGGGPEQYTEEQKQKMRKPRVNKWKRPSSIDQNVIEDIRTLYSTGNYTKTQLHHQFKLSQDTIRNIVDRRGIYEQIV